MAQAGRVDVGQHACRDHRAQRWPEERDDLFGALKNSGSLSGGAASSATVPEPFDHPIKPLLIGTRDDAQLAAAVTYLERAVGRENGAHPG